MTDRTIYIVNLTTTFRVNKLHLLIIFCNALNEKSVLTVFSSNKFVFESKNKPNLI